MNKAITNPDSTCCNCLKETDIHKIEIPKMGYGSRFDGWSTQINLCDDCLSKTNPEWWKLNTKVAFLDFECYEYEKEILDYVKQMPIEGQEIFYNRYSTDDYRMEPQDWIDYKLNELSHEKCKEYGVYSPEKILAYETRFPTCQYPANRIYSEYSKDCWCPFGAYGRVGQIPIEQPNPECYECSYYKERETPIIDVEVEDWDDYMFYVQYHLRAEEIEKKFGNRV
jgi:hypothetical protein